MADRIEKYTAELLYTHRYDVLLLYYRILEMVMHAQVQGTTQSHLLVNCGMMHTSRPGHFGPIIYKSV